MNDAQGAPTDVEWLREVVGYLRSVEADHEADRVAEAADELERLRDSNERWRMAFEAERKHSKQLEERLGRK